MAAFIAFVGPFVDWVTGLPWFAIPVVLFVLIVVVVALIRLVYNIVRGPPGR